MYTNLFHQSPVFTSHTWYTGVQTLIKNHTILSIKRITYPDFKVLGSDLIINSYMLNRAVIKKMEFEIEGMMINNYQYI